MRIVWSVILALFLSIPAYADPFTLKSEGFADKGTIPDSYTCEAGNNTPALNWKNAPEGTKSFTIIFTSLDTPVGMLYNWILFNIPSDITALRAGMKTPPDDASLAQNSFNEMRYRGPCPLDSELHRFIITIYALDTRLPIPENSEPEDVLENMDDHILGEAKLHGVFSH